MSGAAPHRIAIIDSHTGGEPTRMVVSGGPDFGSGSLAEKGQRFAAEFDRFRSAVVNEPRGNEAMVGAWIFPASDRRCVAGVIFFNNVGMLGMCGHGTMGVAVSLAHMGKIGAGVHFLETPVGIVSFDFDGRDRVTIENVPAYRLATKVRVKLANEGRGGAREIVGDIAWGGNWFFLTEPPAEELSAARCGALTELGWQIRRGLEAAGITGSDGAVIDHIEIMGPPHDARNNGRSFVLCPGGAYDRSPCGTGLSAKLACLAAEGKLAAAQRWRQESVTGSVFEAWYAMREGRCIPFVSGTAYVTGEGTLLLDERDPFAWGIGE